MSKAKKEKTTFTEMPLLCGKCGHQWSERLEFPMHADAFIARCKGLGVCPDCGKRDALIMTEVMKDQSI